MLKKIHSLTNSLLVIPRNAKRVIVILSDISLCIVSLWLAFFLRIDQFVSLEGNTVWAAIFSITVAIPIYWYAGLYRTIFRYSGKSVVVSIAFAHLGYTLIYIIIITIIGISGIPRSIGLLQPIVLFFAITGSRLGIRYLFFSINQSNKNSFSLPYALIYGAGNAGRQLASALESSNEMKLVGFVDDDIELHNRVLLGKNVYSSYDLKKVIETKKVTYILLAIPSVSRSRRMNILKKLDNHKIIVRTLPSVTDIAKGKVAISDIRELDLEDIINRNQVSPDKNLLSKNINAKTVLITGAGGSIGSELARQIIRLKPKKLILIELSEFSLYQINTELQEFNNKTDEKIEIITLLASIQNEKRIRKIIEIFKPNTIYHAAAYKHVPLVEENVCEGVLNNVWGSMVVARAAVDFGVSNFVFISSDKAVRPTNVMGASKRLAELCIQAIYAANKQKNSKLSMVRFGNVLGSSGSIIPKFKRQIKNGGPVTLTHPEVTRYFMTIPEAAQLVIQSGAMAEGSDVFILDMGKAIKIKDLIERIIKLSGFSVKDDTNIDGDIEIKITGLRPGEKLYEELLIGSNPEPTLHPKIYKAHDEFISLNKLDPETKKLFDLINQNEVKDVIKLLQKLVNGYNPDFIIVDESYKSGTK